MLVPFVSVTNSGVFEQVPAPGVVQLPVPGICSEERQSESGREVAASFNEARHGG